MTTNTKRKNVGKGHSYLLDGDKVPGVTSILGESIPKQQLVPWAAGVVGEFLAERLDIDIDTGHVDAARAIKALQAIGAASNRYNKWPDDGTISRMALVETIKALPYRDRDAAGRRGTEVHSLAEQILRGGDVTVPLELAGHVDAYLKFLDDFDVREILVEFVCGNRADRWMGTGDMIADLNDGFRWLLDIKTARSGVFPETSLQLAAYRRAEFYLDADGNEQPMLKVDRVGAIWVRADGYELIPLDAGPDTYRTFRHCQRIHLWQTVTGRDTVGESLRPPLEVTE